MTEEKKPFTVSDRRHFTAEGEARLSTEEPAAPVATPKPPPLPEPPAPAKRTAPPPVVDEEAPSLVGGGESAPPMDFVGLLLSLATQAGFLMSPEPGSGAAPDLDGARSIVGLLEILKEKTEGRRTSDEDRVLDGLLYELRMAFVARSRTEKA